MLSRRDQALIEAAQCWIALNGREGGHVKHGPDVRPASADPSLTSQLAAVTIERGQSAQGCDLSMGGCVQFRQLAEQGVHDAIADTGHGAQLVTQLLPVWDALERVAEFGIEPLEFCCAMRE